MRATFLENIASLPSRFTEIHGWWLYGTVRAVRPRLVLETGTCWGFMTAFLAEALEANGDGGRVISIDYYSEGLPHATSDALPIVRQNLERVGVSTNVELIAGEALTTLRELADRGRLSDLGIVVLDDTHDYDHVRREIDLCWPHLGAFGIIAGHDVFARPLIGVNRAFRDAARELGACAVWSPHSMGYCLMQKRLPSDEEPP